MNRLKTQNSPYIRQKNEKMHSARDLHQKKSPQQGKYSDVQQQKLTDKIAMIEERVHEMKYYLIKKKHQKQKLIKGQNEERERLRRERYGENESQPDDRLKKKPVNFSAEQVIKKLIKTQYKHKTQPTTTLTQTAVHKSQQASIIKDLVIQVPEPQAVHHLTSNPYSPRSNIYYLSQVVKTYKDDRSLAKVHIVQSLQIMRTLENTRMPSLDQVQIRTLNLQKRKEHTGMYWSNKVDKKTLIFDLDETLIHCNDSISKPHDCKVSIKMDNGSIIEAGINIRPYAKQIIKNLSKHFQIMIFTASQSCYADQVLNLLDPHRQYIAHRLYRQHCFLSHQGMFVKDLRIINRPLSEQILVDNAAYSYFFQLENGVPIIPYYHGSADFQLRELEKYLLQMLCEKDVRKLNRQTFYLFRYIDFYNTPNKLVEDLYINKT